MNWGNLSIEEKNLFIKWHMGWRCAAEEAPCETIEEFMLNHHTCENYLENNLGVFRIIKKLQKEGYRLTLNLWDGLNNPEGWHCLFQRDFREGEIFESWGCSTAEEAICLTALKTVGVK